VFIISPLYGFYKRNKVGDILIIQGTNKPILIDFGQDMSWLKQIEIGLYVSSNELTTWDINSVKIREGIVECPQTQEQTINYRTGNCVILVKWIGQDGYTQFAQKINDIIVEWDNKNIMGETQDG
jgi:hypothetical protein